MKKILLAFFVLLSFSASSQVLQKPSVYGYQFRRVVVDTLFAMPSDTFSVPATLQSFPFVARKGASLYYWNGSAWVITVGGSTNIYNSDGTLTGNRTVTGSGYDLLFNNHDDILLDADTSVIVQAIAGSNQSYALFEHATSGTMQATMMTNRGGIGNILTMTQKGTNLVSLELSNTPSSGHYQSIYMDSTGMALRPEGGDLFIDSVDAGVGTKAIRWNPATGKVTYADTTTGGSGSSIANYANVYVDSAVGNNGTGEVGNPAKPYATINAALDATSAYPQIIVNIGLGTYDSITPAKIQRSNIWLKGSRQPITNSADTSTSLVNLVITRPTKLIRGTIIQGGVVIYNQNHVKITDLGFDSGVDWRDAGHALIDNVSITDVGTGGVAVPPFALMEGIHIENVTCLGDTATTLKHSMVIENCLDPYINNVLLVGYVTGLGLKNVGGTATNITSYWHKNHGIILKTNNYAPSHETIVSGFVVRSLSETDKESAGFNFQNETGVNVRTGWVVSNGAIRFTSEGMRDYANGDYYNVNISNITIHKTTNSGIYLVGLAKSNINNIIIDSTGGNGIWLANATGGNIVSGCQVLANTSYYGMNITGGTAKSYLYNNFATGNNHGIYAADANVLGEDNVATGNASTQFSGTIAGVLKPYLSSGATSVVGATTAGLMYPLYIGSGLTISSGGGVDSLKATAGGGGSGDVTKVGTPVNNQVGVWTGDGTLEGDAHLTFSGTNLDIGSGNVGRLDLGNAYISNADGNSTYWFNTGANTYLGTNTSVYAMNVNNGKVFFGGSTSPTARIHILAGSATASTAPLKLTTGTSLTTAEAGAMEYTTPQLFFTNGRAVRQEIPQIQQSRVSTQYDNTTTTLGNVTGLTANVAASGTYRFEARLYTTSDVAGGIKVAIGGTATATAIIYEGLTTNAGLSTQSRATALGTAVGAVTAVTAAYVTITGTITVNVAGTLTVQAAANAATGTTSVLVGSTFVLTEMN